jgi:hypothetical protein
MDSQDWVLEWPRCLLLLELANRYTVSGRTQGCEKLKDRLEEWRGQMTDAPSLVHSLLSELCYVSWLLGRGDLAAARHHVAEAERKSLEISGLLRRLKLSEARSRSSSLRRHSLQLQARVHELLKRSALLLERSHGLQRRAGSPRETPARATA